MWYPTAATRMLDGISPLTYPHLTYWWQGWHPHLTGLPFRGRRSSWDIARNFPSSSNLPLEQPPCRCSHCENDKRFPENRIGIDRYFVASWVSRVKRSPRRMSVLSCSAGNEMPTETKTIQQATPSWAKRFFLLARHLFFFFSVFFYFFAAFYFPFLFSLLLHLFFSSIFSSISSSFFFFIFIQWKSVNKSFRRCSELRDPESEPFESPSRGGNWLSKTC